MLFQKYPFNPTSNQNRINPIFNHPNIAPNFPQNPYNYGYQPSQNYQISQGWPKADNFAFQICMCLGTMTINAKNNWARELNIVRWNNGGCKYDIRDWDPAHQKMGKGISLTKEEFFSLYAIMTTEINRLQANHELYTQQIPLETRVQVTPITNLEQALCQAQNLSLKQDYQGNSSISPPNPSQEDFYMDQKQSNQVNKDFSTTKLNGTLHEDFAKQNMQGITNVPNQIPSPKEIHPQIDKNNFYLNKSFKQDILENIMQRPTNLNPANQTEKPNIPVNLGQNTNYQEVSNSSLVVNMPPNMLNPCNNQSREGRYNNQVLFRDYSDYNQCNLSSSISTFPYINKQYTQEKAQQFNHHTNTTFAIQFSPAMQNNNLPYEATPIGVNNPNQGANNKVLVNNNQYISSLPKEPLKEYPIPRINYLKKLRKLLHHFLVQ